MLDARLAGETGMPKFSGGADGDTNRPFGGSRPATQHFQSAFNLSYELDLWGRAAAIRDIGNLEASASTEDLEAARLTVVAATVSTWWRLGHTNQMLDSASAGLAVTERTERIVETMRRAETASDLERFEITQVLETQRAAREALLRERAKQRISLAILLNGSANPIAEPLRLPPGALPELPPGLPAGLISRRPDLRAAEMRLRAALRRTDEKKVSFYPPISLTGSLGAGGQELAHVLANPLATLGTRAVLPFLNLREMGLQVKVSEVQYEEAVTSFRGGDADGALRGFRRPVGQNVLISGGSASYSCSRGPPACRSAIRKTVSSRFDPIATTT
ncbi:TolC family protein [Ensifer canadensis]